MRQLLLGLCLTVIATPSGVDAESYRLWNIDIDRSPAPLPADGPPFSANASRDRSRLPLEISCIVGAYVATVLVLGFLLLTVGRRLRKQALTGSKGQKIEMVRPTNRAFDTSPVSPPMGDRKWYSPKKQKKTGSNKSRINLGSPGIDSVTSFDPNVLQTDKQQRQDELQRLYAAALAHDDALKSNASISQVEITEAKTNDYGAPQREGRRPPQLATASIPLGHMSNDSEMQQYPNSPQSPRSPVRAIYPPDYEADYASTTPTSPVRARYPDDLRARRGGDDVRSYTGQAILARSARASQVSTDSANDRSSPPRRLRRSPKTITIVDAPWQGLPARHERRDGPAVEYAPDAEDLTEDQRSEVSTPGTYTSYRRASAARERESDINFSLPTGSSYHSQPLENDPYRRSSPTYIPPHTLPQSQISSPKMYLEGKALSPSTRSPPFSPAPAVPLSPHPLSPQSPHHLQQQAQSRAFGQTRSPGALGPLPFRALASDTISSPTRAGLPSPGPTKTTYLERRRDMLSPGLRTGGVPRTAGCATPYSAYMPFTPLTPVTPRLATRADRDRRRREEGRRAVLEEEAVKDDDEVWGT